MIEKLGHSKRIQVMRREWIEEEKPRLFDNTGPTREELENPRIPRTPAKSNDSPNPNPQVQEGSAEDLFMPDNEGARPTTSYPEPEEDDLDDLLRDEPMTDILPNLSTSSSRPADLDDDDFDAEYEVMKDLGM
jgi:replication fork protection complex subunit Csm3/Swi3